MDVIISLTDELLYHAREAEIRCKPAEYEQIIFLLDKLVWTKSAVITCGASRNHWTRARDLPKARGLDEYKEGGNCGFLALAVQARLLKFVHAKLQADPRRARKAGRPLLDYVLRPRRVIPIQMPYHHIRDYPSVSEEMVELLLSPEIGADPNQLVRLNGDRSVWELFLLSMAATDDREKGKSSPTYSRLVSAWYAVCKRLVQAGALSTGLEKADQDYCRDKGIPQEREMLSGNSTPARAITILSTFFGHDRAVVLVREMEELEKTRQRRHCNVM